MSLCDRQGLLPTSRQAALIRAASNHSVAGNETNRQTGMRIRLGRCATLHGRCVTVRHGCTTRPHDAGTLQSFPHVKHATSSHRLLSCPWLISALRTSIHLTTLGLSSPPRAASVTAQRFASHRMQSRQCRLLLFTIAPSWTITVKGETQDCN